MSEVAQSSTRDTGGCKDNVANYQCKSSCGNTAWVETLQYQIQTLKKAPVGYEVKWRSDQSTLDTLVRFLKQLSCI